jgi:hypothetical protein
VDRGIAVHVDALVLGMAQWPLLPSAPAPIPTLSPNIALQPIGWSAAILESSFVLHLYRFRTPYSSAGG